MLVNANKLDEQLGTFLLRGGRYHRQERGKSWINGSRKNSCISGRIARVIAHEVRNPLTNILLAVGQFKQDEAPDNDDRQLYLDIIERNCTRINQLVTELLQSTRMMELHLQEYHVNTLVKNALALAEDRIRLNDIRLNEFYTEENVTVQADDEKMNIALLNILINAVEAMGSRAKASLR